MIFAENGLENRTFDVSISNSAIRDSLKVKNFRFSAARFEFSFFILYKTGHKNMEIVVVVVVYTYEIVWARDRV